MKGWTYWRDHALANLGLNEEEADEWATRRLLKPDANADPKQLTLGAEPAKSGQIGPDDEWPKGFF